jgi:hypothetical protein
VDEELRAEMIECQAQIRRWTTEQKHIVDSLALDAQRTLEGDKGARLLLQSSLRHPRPACLS